MNATFTFDVQVACAHSTGFPGSREEPAEPKGYIVQGVSLCGVDITDCLPDSVLAKIERECNS